jgi:histidinol-phosphate/aromatic aminotransferase/cobyric acid decarboxylase-like protein
VNSLAVAAGLAAVTDREFIAATHRWYTASQPELYEGLQEVTNLQVYPSSANFFLLRSVALPFPTIQQRLLEEYRIFVRDCLSFPELGISYGRVALKRSAENQRLLTALRQICEL